MRIGCSGVLGPRVVLILQCLDAWEKFEFVQTKKEYLRRQYHWFSTKPRLELFQTSQFTGLEDWIDCFTPQTGATALVSRGKAED
jgi:hypothetical protein